MGPEAGQAGEASRPLRQGVLEIDTTERKLVSDACPVRYGNMTGVRRKLVSITRASGSAMVLEVQ
jgi:hypothetical protein